MSSTIAAQTLKISITETVTIGGNDRNGKAELDIGSIGQIATGIMEIPVTTGGAGTGSDGRAVIATFGADAQALMAAQNAYIAGDVKYIRLTNKDDSNSINIKVADDNSDEYVVKLGPKRSLIITDTNLEAAAGNINVWTALSNTITDISATAFTGSCDLEYYIAST
jgi:hypothetical protein